MQISKEGSRAGRYRTRGGVSVQPGSNCRLQLGVLRYARGRLSVSIACDIWRPGDPHHCKDRETPGCPQNSQELSPETAFTRLHRHVCPSDLAEVSSVRSKSKCTLGLAHGILAEALRSEMRKCLESYGAMSTLHVNTKSKL